MPPSPFSDLTTGTDDEVLSRAAGWLDVYFVVDLLEAFGVDYALIGAYAMQFNGVVRMTDDVDVLVADDPRNNRRWIAALSRLPDGVASALRGDGRPFDGTAVIRVADEFVVDVMPSANGLTIHDLREHVLRATHHGRTFNVVTLAGLRLLKRSGRLRDSADSGMIETAIADLGRAEQARAG